MPITRHECVVPDWRERLSDAGLRTLAPLLEDAIDPAQLAGSWEALTKPGLGRRERWRWTLDADGGPRMLYIKRYIEPTWREQLDRVLRQCAGHSRAYWEFLQSAQLALACVPAPAAVAFVEKMSGRFERRSAVLFEAVRGEPVDRFWMRAAAEQAPIACGAARRDFISRLARFVAAFHGTGLCHRDLYLCHLFVEADPQYRTAPRFAVIDLARVHQPRWRRMRWLLKDLSQLDASARQVAATRADRLRFLIAYLGIQRGAPRLRWYARRVVARSDRILRRIRRKSGAR